MPDNPRLAGGADRRQCLDRALEAVEGIVAAAEGHPEGLVVVVTALVADSHLASFLVAVPASPRTGRQREDSEISLRASRASSSVAPRVARSPRALNTSTSGVITSLRSEEHTSELQSLMRISYAVF